MEPHSGYAQLGEQRIAYQVLGDGPIDLVLTMGFIGSIDVEWEQPVVRLFFQQMARYARVIRFDRRGTGASDQISLDALPPWEAFADEIDAVMDATGSTEAALLAGGPAGPLGVFYAATRPEKVNALILYHAGVRYLKSEDYPMGWTLEQLIEGQARFGEKWGTGEAFDWVFPSRAGDRRLQSWYAKLERSITSPGAMQKYQEAARDADARALLPSVRAPTLILHAPENDFVPLAWSEYIAENIEDARVVKLSGRDVMPYFGSSDDALNAIEGFLTGVSREAPPTDRKLSTVLFTDIVDSTARAKELGDRRWRELIDLHDELAADSIAEHGGRLVKTTGDGVLATFDGPGRAIRAASYLRDALASLGIRIRTGIHTGEIEIRGGDVGGIAVHLASRIMATADVDETVVSNTVKDLVIGSDIVFEDRGSHSLKGFDADWHLFSVAGG